MKIPTRSNSKIILLVAITLAALTLVAIFTLEKTRMTDFIKNPTYREESQGPTEDEKKEQEKAQAEQKADFLDKNPEEQNTEPAEVPTNSETIKLNLTREDEVVIVRNELHGQGYSSGTCKLTVTNADNFVVQEAQIMYQPEYSMCAGFSVPISSIGSGSWTVILEVTPLNGETLSQTSTIEVRT